MIVRFHPHALVRLAERGATEEEAITTVQTGESFSAKFGRTGFRKTFPFSSTWLGQPYHTKEVEVFAIPDGPDWLVITVLTRYH